MREILFRAKPCYKGGKVTPWVFGEFKYLWCNVVKRNATDNGEHEKRWDKGIIVGEYGKTEVLCDTVGQFTGLYDKNGQKIYESDIVLWEKNNKKYVVKFQSGMFYASVEDCNEGIYGGFPLWMLCIEMQQCEVVGNIHDNPEMLRRK